MFGGLRKDFKMVVKKVVDTKRKKTKRGDIALLDAIIKKHGGMSQISRNIKRHRQHICGWRNTGKIGLISVGPFARALGVATPWGLNYRDLALLMGVEKTPPWEDVVRSYGLSEELVLSILALSAPKPSKAPW